MLVIVHESFEASSQNPTIEEEMTRATNWADLLIDIVPAERLKDSFRYAFKSHNSTFPVNAYEIKAAYESLIAAERKAAAEAKARNEYSVETCKEKQRHNPVDARNPDEGMVDYVDWFDRNLDVTLPCDICRPVAHAQARERHIEKNGGKDLGPVEADAIVKQMVERMVVPETADEVLMKAQTQTRDSDVFMLLQHARNWLRYGRTRGFGEDEAQPEPSMIVVKHKALTEMV